MFSKGCGPEKKETDAEAEAGGEDGADFGLIFCGVEVETEDNEGAIGAFLFESTALDNREGNIRVIGAGMDAGEGMAPIKPPPEDAPRTTEPTEGNSNGTVSFKGERGIGCTMGGSGGCADDDASSNGVW